MLKFDVFQILSRVSLPLSLIAGFAVLYFVYHLVLSPLSYIPGPLGARCSRFWQAYHGWKGDLHEQLLKLHEAYGDTIRTGVNEVATVDVAAVRIIYGVGSKFPKSDWYRPTQGQRKFDLFAERRIKVHGAQRRAVSNIYAMSSLKELEPLIDSSICHFMTKLKEKNGEVIDFGAWIQLFAFDVIGEVTFSRRFGLMDTGEETNTLKMIKSTLKSSAWVSQIPWVYTFHELLRPVFGNHLAITARNGALRDFTAKEVRERQARGSEYNDLLNKLYAVYKSRPQDFCEDDAISMATTNVFAGSDTTALSLRAMFYYLVKNPDSLRVLLNEIDTMTEHTSSPIVSFEAANQMPYLQAVMYEAMRLHPAVGQTLPREVPPEGLRIGNVFLPCGTIVGTSPYVLGRCKQVFGEDADIFRPERWLEGNRAEMQRFFYAFGAGARTCIGKNLSWIEMSKVLPTILKNFHVQLANPNSVWKIECYFFMLQSNFEMILRPRNTVEPT